MTPQTGIAFDIDGVIVDSEPLHFAALQEVVDLPDISVESLVGLSLPQTLLACGVPPDQHETVEKRVTDAYVKRISHADLRPGVQRLLDKLLGAGIPFGFVSTAPRRVCLANLAAALGKRAEQVPLVSGDCIPVTKPHSAPYCAIGRLLKLPASRLIALEDTDIGVCAAMAAGIGRIYAWPNASSRHQTYRFADRVIQRLDECPLFRRLVATPS